VDDVFDYATRLPVLLYFVILMNVQEVFRIIQVITSHSRSSWQPVRSGGAPKRNMLQSKSLLSKTGSRA